MQDNLRILIVEDDSIICHKFQKLIENNSNLVLTGITNNSQKAVALIQDTLPNAVILDLELHAGGGNGIELLQQVKELSLPVIPFFLITTHNTSVITYEMARTLGADFIMHKHEDGYSEKKVIDFLNIMSNIILKNTKTNLTPTETPSQKAKRLISHIHAQLNLIGVSPKLKGYCYLTDAILLVYHGETYHVCAKIGTKYNKTESSVERAMQNAINKAWCSTDIDTLLKYYDGKINSEKGVPTVTEFIHYYANILNSKY